MDSIQKKPVSLPTSELISTPVPLVRDFMTEDVFTVHEKDNFVVIDALMSWKKIRHVPVTNIRNELVGLVTHRDVLRAAVEKPSDTEKTISNVMRSEVVTVSPDTWLCDAAKMIVEKKIGCLPVLDRKRLVGILTEADFVRAFYN